MEERRRTWLARTLLVAGVALCAGWLARLDYAAKVSIDVLDLLPVDEREPDLVMVRSLAGERQARVVLLALRGTSDGADVPAAVRSAFVQGLEAAGVFEDVVRLDDPAARESMGRFVFSHRLDLLFPGWLAEKMRQHALGAPGEKFDAWITRSVVSDLDAWLEKPEALGGEEILAADPLLLVPRLVNEVPALLAGDAVDGIFLVWAKTKASPMTEAGQRPVFAAIEHAFSLAKAISPDVRLQWTGVGRFAAASRARIQNEVQSLNTVAIVAVVLVLVVFLRRAWQVIHLLPIIACSLLGAWTATTLIFERVHVLVFVVGSLLAGVAVDYGLHVFLHRGSQEDSYTKDIRSILRPLLGSAVTTCIGFSLLVTSELPLLRHMGVFVTAGVVCAVLAALLWFAQVRHSGGAVRFDGGSRAPSWPRMVPVTLGVIGAGITLGGVWRLTWRDDIRELEIRSPELWENDRDVRGLFGESPHGRSVLLTRGTSAGEARAALDEFRAWMAAQSPDASVASVGFALPTEADWRAVPDRMRDVGEFEANLRAALESGGYDSEGFEPFFASWRTWSANATRPEYEGLVTDFIAALRGPATMGIEARKRLAWFAVAVEGVTDPGPIPAELNTVPANQLQSLNTLFSRYRTSALRLSLIGLGLAALSVIVMFGFRRGMRMAVVPLGACAVAFGVLGLAGQTLNLFHLLGAFLAICLSFDYGIFAVESAARGEGVPASIRLSALTTMASFGVLALSAIPVVSALGVSVALVVAVALAIVETWARARAG